MFQEFKYLYLFLRLGSGIALLACRTQQCHTSSSFNHFAFIWRKLEIFSSFFRDSFRQLLVAVVPIFSSLCRRLHFWCSSNYTRMYKLLLHIYFAPRRTTRYRYFSVCFAFYFHTFILSFGFLFFCIFSHSIFHSVFSTSSYFRRLHNNIDKLIRSGAWTRLSANYTKNILSIPLSGNFGQFSLWSLPLVPARITFNRPCHFLLRGSFPLC